MSPRSARPIHLAPSPARTVALVAGLVLSVAFAATATAQSADPRAEAARLDSVGAALMQGERYRVAIDTLRRAMELDPSRAVTARRLGTAHIEFADFDQAQHWLGRASALDSIAPPTIYWTAFLHALRGDDAAARRLVDRLPATAYGTSHRALLELFVDGTREGAPGMARRAAAVAAVMPEGAYRHLFAGDAALHANRLDDAEAQYRAALAISPDARNGPTGHFAATSLAIVLRASGRVAASDSLLERAMRMNHARLAEGRDSQGYPYDIASAYAIQGSRSEALKWLGKAVDAGWRKERFTALDPAFRSIRHDADFQRLVRRMSGGGSRRTADGR